MPLKKRNVTSKQPRCGRAGTPKRTKKRRDAKGCAKPRASLLSRRKQGEKGPRGRRGMGDWSMVYHTRPLPPRGSKWKLIEPREKSPEKTAFPHHFRPKRSLRTFMAAKLQGQRDGALKKRGEGTRCKSHQMVGHNLATIEASWAWESLVDYEKVEAAKRNARPKKMKPKKKRNLEADPESCEQGGS